MAVLAEPAAMRRLRERLRLRRSLPPAAELRAARIRAGLTQREVADALGVTVGAVIRYESGVRRPRPWVAERYAALLEALAKDAPVA
jgi:DNA-binding XRE family transcriptional regulator